MSQVGNYYSINPSDPDVYHDQSNCPSGQQIPGGEPTVGHQWLPEVQALPGYVTAHSRGTG